MIRLGIAAESSGDATLITGLVDRVLLDEHDWVTDDTLDDYRVWGGLRFEPFLDLHNARDEAKGRRLRIHGHFGGEPGEADAQMFRAVLLLFLAEDTVPEVVVISRDLDGDEDRAKGFEQALAHKAWPFTVVPALARPEIEGFRLLAWRPETEAETKALAAARQRLGFCPTRSPERLTSKKPTDPKDAKTVKQSLCDEDNRWEEAWRRADLRTLQEAGEGCGLARLLREARKALTPSAL
ncbi:MAG: hypothetical protein IPI35_27025 [Deltaproteobacteria bacterium]|nr:hypothetical protein [Deltaproteobacteria bacterium]